MRDLQKRLLDKSIEAFIMSIEIYNKPTIKYRIEGFSFFICNAWELMLKSKMLSNGKDIYFKDNPDRTFDLGKVVQLIYTDQKQPLRINLEKIIELRNTSTHFVTEDYETVYAPLFQSAVNNFIHEIDRFHNVDMTKYIAQNFLTLFTNMNELTSHEIKIKYDPATAERLLLHKNDIEITSKTLDCSNKFAISVDHRLLITKSKNNADFTMAIDKNSQNSGNIIKEYKDPADTHKYSYTTLLTAISTKLSKENIKFEYQNISGNTKTKFTSTILNLFIDFYDMKRNPNYAYRHIVGKSTSYTYSQQAYEFIFAEIKKDPRSIIGKLRKAKNKITPGT